MLESPDPGIRTGATLKTIKLINRGGFGEVYEVEKRGKRLACKRFAPPAAAVNAVASDKLMKRFAREVRIQSRLRHPNIMPIIDFDLDQSPAWFTMPLATRSFEESTREYRSDPDFSGDIDIAVWQDILAGVEELHRLGYVHRDLKPANVLLVNDTWVLADFGLILPTARETTILTSSHSAYGSHFYAAPEQANDFRNVPEQTDIFALGCMLHDAVNPGQVRVPFAQINGAGVYGSIIGKCTEVDPRDRYRSVSLLRAALFDVYQAKRGEPESPEDSDCLEAVLVNPRSASRWKQLILLIEEKGTLGRHVLLQSISAELISQLNETDDVLFTRLMTLICEWARSTGFDWSYCDVVGDRLIAAYRISPVRICCDIVLSALDLAVSHNRWHVMNQVGSMLGQTADTGLVDRILIETELRPKITEQLLRIEEVVEWPRKHWHPKIALYLTGDED